jgi:hypothetical protein
MRQKNSAALNKIFCARIKKARRHLPGFFTYRMELAADAARGQTNLFQFQIFRCALAAVFHDLILNVLTFIERA